MRPTVFIASPLSATGARTHEDNIIYARNCMFDSLWRGEAPYAPHLLYTQVLNDTIAKEREIGIAAALPWLAKSRTLAVYVDHGISPGMQKEIEMADDWGIHIEHRGLEDG